MRISVEISYYALQDNYNEPIGLFIEELSKYNDIEISTGVMSTILSGEYNAIFTCLTSSIKPFFEKYPSVFKLTIANACDACMK